MEQQSFHLLLSDLWSGGRFDLVETKARELLSIEPEDEIGHYYLGRVLTHADRLIEAKGHIDFLLAHSPGDPWNQHAASVYCWKNRQHDRAIRHINEAIALLPEEPAFFHLRATIHVQSREMSQALCDAERARQLDPTNPEYARLWIQTSASDKADLSDAIRRIEQLEATLALDPENAGVHNALGVIYFNELHDAVSAEREFFQCVRLATQNPTHTQNLFLAVIHRSLFYRTLKLPILAYRSSLRLASRLVENPFGFVLWILTFKFWFGFLIWIGALALLSWPLLKAYEWLLVSEILATTRTDSSWFRFLARFHRLPFWIRLLLFVAIFAAPWSGIFLLVGVPLHEGLGGIVLFFATNFALVAIWRGWRTTRIWLSLRERRKHRTPPDPPRGR